MSYRAPLDAFRRSMAVIGAERLAQTERFAEATPETVEAVLGEAGRIAADVLAPLQRPGDLHPARLENGVVRSAPGYAEGYTAIAEGGWVGICAQAENGGMDLPQTLGSAVGEMFASACLSLSLCPLLSQGQIEALEHHAPDWVRENWLPKLVSGEWTGTMNLTEPQAGSDVGALRSKAEPVGDGSYKISGQKIYISWGDHDLAGNVLHLVLARLPDAPKGTRGVSLFIVPKLIDTGDSPAKPNSLRVVSLEHKLGLHGSPTCVMEFDGATGWLVGPEHGGMACMFTMMNNARLGVGVQGVGIAEAACQKALAFALDRKQGRTPTGDGRGPIADHADVRRMLMRMQTLTAVARMICLDCAFSLDMARAAPEGERGRWADRAAFLTPIAKAFGTDAGCEVADLGIQIHGGMGFVEETGAAQFLRDVRVTTIYEGTNGIQALDLVGRKLADGGAVAQALIEEMAEAGVSDAVLGPLRDATGWMLGADPQDRAAGATAYLDAFALALGARYLDRSAALAPGDLRAEALAAYHRERHLPRIAGLCAEACVGAGTLYALAPEALAADAAAS
ncbi:MAG: acyl-CoA dehydrogenase [Pseudomonadota bacterium]